MKIKEIKMTFEIPSVTEAWRELTETYGRLTVAEALMTTGGSGTSLAQLVSARAAYQMLTKMDARNFCRLEQVPPGGGKTYHVQRFTAQAGGSASEGATISTTNETLSDVLFNLTIYAIRTDVSDLLQRQAAVNFADAIGRQHGNAMIREVNNAVYTALGTNTANCRTISGSGEQEVAWADVLEGMRMVEGQRGEPDTLITHPKKLHEFIRKDAASQLFTTAYVDYIRTGKVNTVAGMAVYSDAVYGGGSWAGSAGEKYMHILQSDEAIGWAQAWDVSTEIQRLAENIGFKMVTSLAGASAEIVDEFIASIEHA